MVLLVLELMNWRKKQKKRVALTVEAAEDYARRFKSGVNDLTLNDHAGEEVVHSGMNIMCFLGEGEGSERARRMLSCKTCGKKYHKNCLKSWAQHRGT
ncbi:unnamed protein product [Arabidopsis halleri]